jgi:hypothetical protein
METGFVLYEGGTELLSLKMNLMLQKVKESIIKLSRYMSWRHVRGEEV